MIPHIPFIPDLEKLSFEQISEVMELKATRQSISQINWPKEFPYCPIVSFDIAHSSDHICIRYFVRGLGLKAEFTNDHDPVWRDSCVEFFVASQDKQSYFNFEMNCIGAVLATKRKGRDQDVQPLSDEAMSRIIRRSSLARESSPEKDGIHEWSAFIAIPYDIIGLDSNSTSIFANFYKCADDSYIPHYVSWAPIDTANPDFHRSEFFSQLIID